MVETSVNVSHVNTSIHRISNSYAIKHAFIIQSFSDILTDLLWRISTSVWGSLKHRDPAVYSIDLLQRFVEIRNRLHEYIRHRAVTFLEKAPRCSHGTFVAFCNQREPFHEPVEAEKKNSDCR